MRKKLFLVSLVAVVGWGIHLYHNITKKLTKKARMQERYANILQDWFVREMKENITKKYFSDHPEYKKIAIYGAGSLAEVLYNKLKECKIQVSYIADKEVENIIFDFERTTLIKANEIEEQESVDCIIISPINYYDEIYKDLQRMPFAHPIISLEDIVYYEWR